MKLHWILNRYMAPAGEGDAGGGGTTDRGDDFTPTGDDAADGDKGKTVDPADKAAADALAELEAKAKKDAADADPVAAAEKEAADKAAAEKEAADKAAAEKGDKGKKDTRLPLARHEEILGKERERREAVEAELAKYKQGKTIADMGVEITKAEETLLTLEAKYAKEVTDGEAAKAAATMAEIRKTERSINAANSRVEIEAAEARAVERVRYDTIVERVETQFNELNPDHADYDKAKAAEVVELKEAYMLKGHTPTAALQKAVKLIMPPTTKAQETVLDTTPRVDAAAVEAARKKAAVEATAKAVAATPASSAKVGNDSDKAGGGAITAKDAIKMDHAAFGKLNEETLAVMRGDVL